MGSVADLRAIGMLSALWMAVVLCVGIEGEFPLNDDFAYNISTERYVRTGVLQRIDWTWTLIISNVAVGALFSSLFGYSMEVMRLSSVVLGWAGIVGAYAFARHFRLSPMRSALVAATLACNPLYVSLSFTFMLDVAFTAFIVWGAYLLARGLEFSNDHTRRPLQAYRMGSLAVGLAFSAAAMLSRQSGFALALAFVVTAVLSRLTLRTFMYASVAGVCFLLMYWGSRHVFGGQDARLHVSFGIITYSLEKPEAAFITLQNTVMTMTFLGVFLFPVFLAVLPAGIRRARWPLVAALPLSVLGVYALRRLQVPEPFGYNVLGNFFVGTVTIDPRGFPELPMAFWNTVCGIGLYGFITVAFWLMLQIKRLLQPTWILVLSFTGIYLAPHLIRAPLFDRYLLPLLVPLAVMTCVLLCGPEPKPSEAAPSAATPAWLPRVTDAAALLVAALFLFWSTAGSHDYLERNRAMWRLIPEQVARGVPPTDFNAGVEYRGMIKYTQPRWEHLLEVVDESYDEPVILSTLPALDGYQEIASASYARWLPPMGERRVIVYQRVGYTPPGH